MRMLSVLGGSGAGGGGGLDIVGVFVFQKRVEGHPKKAL